MVTSADFTNGPLGDHGQTATRTPVTTSIHNITGEKVYTDAATTTFSCVFENANKKYDFNKSGLSEGADARMFINPSVTLNKNDKVTLNSATYRVDTISKRFFGANAIFYTVLLFEI